VFGTLKQGFPNHHVNKGERMPGTFKTADKFLLYLVGPRNTPWLVDDPGRGMRIVGEVYRVSEEMLAQMDVLERINEPDGYRRISIPVMNQVGSTFQAAIYVKPLAQLAGVETNCGPISEYTLEHAKLYQQRPSRLVD
jgi:gamma-glutamylaminecyclotransferase